MNAHTSNNDAIYLCFYPFYDDLGYFSKEDIGFNFVDARNGKYRGTFAYNEETIMEVELGLEGKGPTDKEVMKERLISNFELVL